MDRGDMMKIKKVSLKVLINNKGFSLVEVLVALTILSVGLLGVAGTQIMSVSSNAFGREMQMAILVGQDFIETLKDMDKNDPNLAQGSHGKDNKDDTLKHLIIPDVNNPALRYTQEWNILDNIPFNDTKQITVTVSWRNQAGDHQIELHTTRWWDRILK